MLHGCEECLDTHRCQDIVLICLDDINKSWTLTYVVEIPSKERQEYPHHTFDILAADDLVLQRSRVLPTMTGVGLIFPEHSSFITKIMNKGCNSSNVSVGQWENNLLQMSLLRCIFLQPSFLHINLKKEHKLIRCPFWILKPTKIW